MKARPIAYFNDVGLHYILHYFTMLLHVSASAAEEYYDFSREMMLIDMPLLFAR